MTTKNFAQHLHRLPNPWQGDVEPWALELREMAFHIIYNQERLMSALDDSKAAIATLIDVNGKLVAEIQRLDAKVTGAAPPAATEADLQAITTEASNAAAAGSAALTASQQAVP